MASELVLAPVVDRNALKKSQNQMQESMAMAGKKASMSIRNELKNNVKRGTSEGFRDGVRDSMPTMKSMGAMLAVAAGAAVYDTVNKTMGTLEQNLDRILGKLDSFREITRNAEAFSMDPARYAAISVMGTSAGLDQGDISGIMAGFVAALKDEEMAGFSNIAKEQGTEKAFFDFLSSASKLSDTDRQQRLISAFGEDDMRLVSRFMNPMMQMQNAGQQLTLQSLFQQMTGTGLNLEAIQAGLSKTSGARAMLTKQQTEQQLQQLISGVTPQQAQAVTAVSASQKRLESAQMSALELQVKGKIIADNMEIKQIEMGKGAIQSMFGYADDAKSFVESPSISGLWKLDPISRMLASAREGAPNTPFDTKGLITSGAAGSPATAPLDFIQSLLKQAVDSLNNMSEASTKGLEQQDANKFRTY